VQPTKKLEIKSSTGVTFTSPGYETGKYPDKTEQFWDVFAPIDYVSCLIAKQCLQQI
jgi:hypothetical protein